MSAIFDPCLTLAQRLRIIAREERSGRTESLREEKRRRTCWRIQPEIIGVRFRLREIKTETED